MLENTAYRLSHSLPLTLAYFGGSITEGAGASTYDQCWAAKTTAWFRENWPGSEIRHVQAAIGGTDSTLGVHRCDRDVCASSPDLVFYEFAVNDGLMDYTTALKNAEACFLKIWEANPFADIVVVYTVTKFLSDYAAAGGVLSAKAGHAAAAFRYGVPQVDFGDALRTRILTEGADWFRYTVDTVHPNDAGYEIYASVLRDRLKEWISGAVPLDSPEEKDLPAPLFPEEESHVTARLVDCTVAAAPRWILKEESLCGRYPRYLESVTPGDELTFSFEGRRIGFYWMMAKDSGDALCSIDGGRAFPVRSWDHYCKSFDRANAVVIADGLENGPHTLRLWTSADKASESEGHALRIGAFLVM